MNRVALTRTFYQQRISDVDTSDQHESKAQKVGWKSRDVQLLTFETATDLDGIRWKEISSVLDIGCGYGNLAEYLRSRHGFVGTYTGIDVVPEFVDGAQKTYGHDERNRFITGDVLAQNWQGENGFDVVFCLGALTVNHDQPEPYGAQSQLYADKLIDMMLSQAKNAVVLHFPNEDNMSEQQRERNPDMAFYRPETIENMLRQAADTKLKTLSVAPYPGEDDVRTMARLLLRA